MSEKCEKCGHNPATDHLKMREELAQAVEELAILREKLLPTENCSLAFMVDVLRANIEHFKNKFCWADKRADEAEAALPATFYAGRPLGFRIERMVVSWNRAIRAAVEIEAEAKREPAEVLLKRIDTLKNALQLILPMAKGYANAHPVGSNQEHIEVAEAASNPATPTPRHVCGLMGFGQPGDKCPACQAAKEDKG